jgi:oligopeptide/dipeptide ABC transporter ATP-binding protein
MPGSPPPVGREVEGCRFYSRCSVRSDECRHGQVNLLAAGEDHLARCLFSERLDAPPESIPVAVGGEPR